MKRRIFIETPFNLFKEKKFSTHRRVNVYFLWTKKSKMQENLSIFHKKVFYKQARRFSSPFQIFMPDIRVSKLPFPTVRPSGIKLYTGKL